MVRFVPMNSHGTPLTMVPLVGSGSIGLNSFTTTLHVITFFVFTVLGSAGSCVSAGCLCAFSTILSINASGSDKQSKLFISMMSMVPLQIISTRAISKAEEYTLYFGIYVLEA